MSKKKEIMTDSENDIDHTDMYSNSYTHKTAIVRDYAAQTLSSWIA